MTDDAQLLRRYVESRSEADFTALVERHLGLVYHAALRRTHGRADLAQDAAQQVFITLAMEAPRLVSHSALVGWLFTATRHAAGHVWRGEQRRLVRETDAFMSRTLENSESGATWDEIRPQLDEALDTLPEADRTAILLRFFHQQPFAAIGGALGLTEDTARKRVDRALDRLRALLARRGVTSTASALGVMLAQQATAAVPLGLARTIATTALLPGAAATLPGPATLLFMKTKLTLGLAGTLGLACLLTLPPLGLALAQHHEAAQAESSLLAARSDHERRAAELGQLRQRAREADQDIATLQAELIRARAAGAAVARTPTVPPVPPPRSKAELEALADGRELFARFPEARPSYLAMSRAQVHVTYADFYRAGHLSPAQIEEFEARTADQRLATLAVMPNGMRSLESRLPDGELRQIFGEEAFLRFQDFERGRTAHSVARTAAVTAGWSAPIYPAQADALVRSIQRHSADYQDGRSLNTWNVDWARVIAEARDFLAPDQWRAVHSTLLSAQLARAIEQAQRAAAPEKPKS